MNTTHTTTHARHTTSPPARHRRALPGAPRPFGIWDFALWNLRARSARAASASRLLGFGIFLGFGILGFGICSLPLQAGAQLVVLVDKTPIVIEAPRPFVEVSRLLPGDFAQRAQAIAPANRLLTWFIPALSLKDQLNDKPDRPRSLQVQVMREMEPVRYDAKSFATLRAQTAQGMAQVSEEDADTLFAMLDLRQLTQRAGRRILGISDLGADSFTLCIATSTEGSDQRGGREIETSVSCVTYLLLNEKIILLTVSVPELTAKELRNSQRLTREWITLLRAHNNAK